jgi:hypothetical protein
VEIGLGLGLGVKTSSLSNTPFFLSFHHKQGRIFECIKVLQAALSFLPYNEALTVRLVRMEEKMSDLASARALLGLCVGINIEQSWRVLMEGALFETRCGNAGVARNILVVGMIAESGERKKERKSERKENQNLILLSFFLHSLYSTFVNVPHHRVSA